MELQNLRNTESRVPHIIHELTNNFEYLQFKQNSLVLLSLTSAQNTKLRKLFQNRFDNPWNMFETRAPYARADLQPHIA